MTTTLTDKYEASGYRFIDADFGSEPKKGDFLDNSFVWDGDEITETELDGTCAFDSYEKVKDYAKYSTGWIVRIGGDLAGYGDLSGEILIKSATVLEIEKI